MQSPAQLRYLPAGQPHQLQQQPLYATPPNQQVYQQQQRYGTRYSIKRPRYDDGTLVDEEEYGGGQGHPPTQAVVTHPAAAAGFQIRHRSTDKTRGLRHFAHKVCEKVKEKGQTNYNEVADELVTEYFDQLVVDVPQDPEKYQYDVRNIRRRVYDALNVLMAMNIIEKEKKEIRWVGLPTSSLAECRRLEEENTQRRERIRQKTEQLQELIVQLVAYKSLVQRNRERERQEGRPANSSILYLPYIIVSTDKKTLVECAIAPDKSEYWFNFDRPFEIHDDIEVLKRLGLACGIDRCEVLPEHVQHIKACLPPALRDYVDQIVEGTLSNRTAKTTSSSHQSSQSLVKLDPNSSAVHSAPSDSIVVKATRANLSGIAPAGDGGPMRSFLGPMNPMSRSQQPQMQVQQAHQAAPLARYAVIPRPVSARYSMAMSRHVPMPPPPPPPHSSLSHSSYQQQRPHHQRLGGAVHYEGHPPHGQIFQQVRHNPGTGMEGEGEESEGQMYEYAVEAGQYVTVEEYLEIGGEQIVEEVVTEE